MKLLYRTFLINLNTTVFEDDLNIFKVGDPVMFTKLGRMLLKSVGFEKDIIVSFVRGNSLTMQQNIMAFLLYNNKPYDISWLKLDLKWSQL